MNKMDNFDLKKYLAESKINELSLSKLDFSPLSEGEKDKLIDYLEKLIGIDFSSQRVNSKEIQEFFISISSKISQNKLLSPPIGKTLFRGVKVKENEKSFIEKCIKTQNIKPITFTKANRFAKVTHACTTPFQYSPSNSITYWTDSIEGVNDFIEAEYYGSKNFIIHTTKCIEGKFIFSKRLLDKVEQIVLPMEEINFNVDITRKGYAENATIGISNNYTTYILFNMNEYKEDQNF
jgi:hypothetical protein